MENRKMSDAQLIEQFRKGNKNAINELLSRYSSNVYSYILMMVKNEELANDFLQETFIKVFESIKRGKYEEKGIFLSWVIRIAHNLIIDFYRKNRHLPTVSNDEADYDLFNSPKFADKNVEQNWVESQVRNDIRRLIEMLPPEQREVVLLRHYGGLSFKEIAKLTGVSINTALGRMRYALINLRRLVKKHRINLFVD